MRRYANFGDFWDYTGVGVVTTFLLMVFGIPIGAIACNFFIVDDERELLFYKVVAHNGKFFAEERNVENVRYDKKALVIMKQYVLSDALISFKDQYSLVIEPLQALADSTSDISYADLVIKKREVIEKVYQGKLDPQEAIKVLSWDDFWNWTMIGGYAFLIISCTGFFIQESRRQRESILDLPWRKFWVYPTVIFMSPVLAPCLVAALVWRWEKMWSGKIVPFEEQIKSKKAAAETLIDNIDKRIAITKKSWENYFLMKIEKEGAVLKTKVREAKNRLSNLGSQIASLQKNIADYEKQYEEWRRQTQTRKNKAPERHNEQFDLLLKLEKVAAVEFSGNGSSLENYLYIYTKPIYIDYDDQEKYEIGILRIVINLKSNYVDRVENLCSTHPDGYHHPYAIQGKFCWGAVNNYIEENLRQGEYAVAVQYMLEAICSNKGDKPNDVKQWRKIGI